MKNTKLFIGSTNILVRLLTVNMKNCLTPENPKMCDPILVTLLKMRPNFSQSSRENAAPSRVTSSLASYKEVPPPPDQILCPLNGGVLDVSQRRGFTVYRTRVNWIAHVRYNKILTSPRLYGQYCESLTRNSRKTDLSTKKTRPNIEKWPESLGVMLEFQYSRTSMCDHHS